jgi:hypothetical protein
MKLTTSPVFKDMLELPQVPIASVREPDVIPLDEEGEDVERFFDCLILYDMVSSISPHSLRVGLKEIVAILSICKALAIEGLERKVEYLRQDHLRLNSPFSILKVASHRQDCDLGKQALLRMSLDEYEGKPDAFCEAIADLRLEWQIELAKIIMPVLVFGQSGLRGDFRKNIKTATQEHLQRAVGRFEPA